MNSFNFDMLIENLVDSIVYTVYSWYVKKKKKLFYGKLIPKQLIQQDPSAKAASTEQVQKFGFPGCVR